MRNSPGFSTERARDRSARLVGAPMTAGVVVEARSLSSPAETATVPTTPSLSWELLPPVNDMAAFI